MKQKPRNPKSGSKSRVFDKAQSRRKIKSDEMNTNTTLSNREIMNLVLGRSFSFETITEIDNVYGESINEYIACQSSPNWLKWQIPATNWSYCPCCGNTLESGCNCDSRNESDFVQFSNNEIFNLVKKLRNSADRVVVDQEKSKISFCFYK